MLSLSSDLNHFISRIEYMFRGSINKCFQYGPFLRTKASTKRFNSDSFLQRQVADLLLLPNRSIKFTLIPYDLIPIDDINLALNSHSNYIFLMNIFFVLFVNFSQTSNVCCYSLPSSPNFSGKTLRNRSGKRMAEF
jgi:hypothetical protein